MEIEAATGKKAGRWQALAALRHRNFRLFWSGQLISSMGTWMQNMAQGWLVLQMTNSPFLLGVVSAIQFTLLLLLALVAGVVADRVPKRRLLVITQASLMLLALLFLVFTGWSMITFIAPVNTTLQLNVPDYLRGRVMSVYSLVFGGVTPIGSLFSGSFAHLWGAPAGLAAGAILGLISLLAVIGALRKTRLTIDS